nr:hypothetical protein [Mycobacterium genavense]
MPNLVYGFDGMRNQYLLAVASPQWLKLVDYRHINFVGLAAVGVDDGGAKCDPLSPKIFLEKLSERSFVCASLDMGVFLRFPCSLEPDTQFITAIGPEVADSTHRFIVDPTPRDVSTLATRLLVRF